MTRRGACPSLGVPMQTGDGLLVRLRPRHRELSSADLAGLAAASERFGNGRIEITARGNLQVRGLRSDTVEPFARAVSDLEAEWMEGVPVEVGALAGLDAAEIADPRPVADEVLERLAGSELAGRLGPKVSVLIDGGGVLPLDAVQADVRLRAVADGGWRMTADGGEALVEAPAASAVAALATLGGVPRRALGRAAEAVGIHRLRDGTLAVGFALPFGQVTAAALGEFAARIEAPIRLAPGRALLAVGLDGAAAASLQGEARRLGFVTDAADARRVVAACPGCPDCSAGEIPARALAEQALVAASVLLDGSIDLHISGCAKGCAHPAPATIGLVGVADGCDVVLHGLAVARLSPSQALHGLALLAQEIASRRSDPAETAAQALARLGPGRTAGLLRGQAHV